MKSIAAIAENLALGKNGQLLYSLPSDMAHFKSETLGGIVIMGRKTLESMPNGKPLPGRHTMVLSSSMKSGIWVRKTKTGSWVLGVFNTVDSMMEYLGIGEGGKGSEGRNISVCGGGEIYRLLMPWCSELVLTEVQDSPQDVDTWYPDFRASGEWALFEKSEELEENGFKFTICRYKRA